MSRLTLKEVFTKYSLAVEESLVLVRKSLTKTPYQAEDKRRAKEDIQGTRRMKKPMPIKPRARKVSFCQVFLKYNRKTKLVTTAAMQVPRARPVQMKLICLLGTPT